MTLKNKIKIKITLTFLAIATVLVFFVFQFKNSQGKLLIAPMVGGLDFCFFEKNNLKNRSPSEKYTSLCMQDKDSPSALIEKTLQKISENKKSEKYELGYTLYVPLLKLFKPNESIFEINKEAVKRVADTIGNTKRSVVLYLFSDHFSVGSPLESILSKKAGNILETKNGKLAIDKYYGENIYPWSFTNKKNDITHLREIAFNAVLDEVCKLPAKAIDRIAGVTMLGELHHMFPDFQGGMGFSGDYLITDYSQHSIEGFQDFLASRYISIANFNKKFGTNYQRFKDVSPPSKNIRNERLNTYFEHIDAYAHGILPISGWVAIKAIKSNSKEWIHIYQNGAFLARIPVAFGRQDVLAAHPELSSSDVGWQYNLDFSTLPPGIYNIDIFLENSDATLSNLATRQISIMDKSQSAPPQLPYTKLKTASSLSDSVLFSVDNPSNFSSYYFNPLAVQWHEFRKKQVSSYIKNFSDIAKNKCIKPDLIFSHQILPFVNPGWDETKFAVGRDLAVPPDVRLGISLYGEASYGTSFFEWFSSTQRPAYGVTEFHPLKGMTANELDVVFSQHNQNGAKFISFFADSAGLDDDPANKLNIFSFNRKNKNAGSDVLFDSVAELLK